MKKATVSHLKDNLSAYLRRVRAGHAVVIYDRDVPVARLEGIAQSGASAERLAALEAQGTTSMPRKPRSAAELVALLDVPPPRSSRLLAALLQDRDEGR